MQQLYAQQCHTERLDRAMDEDTGHSLKNVWHGDLHRLTHMPVHPLSARYLEKIGEEWQHVIIVRSN